MKMWKIICYILLMGLCLNALADTTKPKIAYINVSFPSADTGLYVGQDIEVKYSLTLLSGAKLAVPRLRKTVRYHPFRNIFLH